MSATLIVLGCLLVPVGLLAGWAGNQITDTDRYVTTVAPLADDPAIQKALADRATQAVMDNLDVAALVAEASQSLPPRAGSLLSGLSGPASSAIQGYVRNAAGSVVTSDAFAKLWTSAHRIAHERANKILSGDDSALIQSEDGTIVLDLGPLVQKVRQHMVERGMAIAAKIPDVHPEFELATADQLERAQTAYRWTGVLRWAVPLLALALLCAGVLLARSRRRALVRAGLGTAFALALLAVGLMIARGTVTDNAPQSPPAMGALFDGLTALLKIGLRLLLILALLVAAGAWLTGPAQGATAVRERWTALLRGRVALPWVTDHRRALQTATAVVAILTFIFWPHPTGLVLLSLLAASILLLALIELTSAPQRTRTQ